MTPQWSTHLSEEALDDVLIGLGSRESEAHLAGCPDCRAKVTSFRADMDFFNSASMEWSEARTLRMPPAASRVAAGSATRIAFASWAAVTFALLIMAVAIWRHTPVATPNHAHTIEAQPMDTEAQIAQDNQLLQAVNAAISPDEGAPLNEYKLLKKPHSRLKAHPK